MLPLNYDIRMMYRKHQVGDTVVDGIAEPTWETDGPHMVAFRPGREIRESTPQGYDYGKTNYMCIAPDTDAFQSGDVLTDGTKDLYQVLDVGTYPTEQIFHVRAID